MSFKLSGFSRNNIFIGLFSLGNTYIEIIYEGTKSIFNSIFNFLDNYIHKPQSNLSNNPNDYKIWKWTEGSYDTRPVNPNPLGRDSLDNYDPPRYEYKPRNENISFYKGKDNLSYTQYIKKKLVIRNNSN